MNINQSAWHWIEWRDDIFLAKQFYARRLRNGFVLVGWLVAFCLVKEFKRSVSMAPILLFDSQRREETERERETHSKRTKSHDFIKMNRHKSFIWAAAAVVVMSATLWHFHLFALLFFFISHFGDWLKITQHEFAASYFDTHGSIVDSTISHLSWGVI